jgi:2-hydroxychromene-2-carboxylate isomerase
MLSVRDSGKPLRCYFSLRSPYSWLAMRALDKADLGIGSQLDYIPYFEPDPAILERLRHAGGDFLYTPMRKEKNLYILSDVKRLMRDEDLRVKWPVDLSPDWALPHLTYLACESLELRKAFAFAAMEARWLKGESLWCWENIWELLAGVSTPDRASDIVRDAQSDEIVQRGVNDLFQAYLDGVFGVPFLLMGREKFWGNDRVSSFLKVMEEKVYL